MECYENGLIDAKETGGLGSNWGDAERLGRPDRSRSGEREGFGAMLADGAKLAAEQIGRGSEQFAMHVAGRAVPYHDPRMAPSGGTFYISDASPPSIMGPQGMASARAGCGPGF